VHFLRDALPEPRDRTNELRVIGVGNAYRSDDAVGLAVARAVGACGSPGLTALEREGEPTSLMDSWDGADVVWLVDAVSSGAAPGTVHRFEATSAPLPDAWARTSTHHFGLPEAIELARAVGRLPRRLIVFGVEGGSFEIGESLTPPVEAAVAEVAAAIRDEAAAAARPTI
jgi:hydrogenase maturation protease